jgi:hypothetical protein
VECKERSAVGVVINPDAVMVARNRLDFSYAPLDADYLAPEIKTYARDTLSSSPEKLQGTCAKRSRSSFR